MLSSRELRREAGGGGGGGGYNYVLLTSSQQHFLTSSTATITSRYQGAHSITHAGSGIWRPTHPGRSRSALPAYMAPSRPRAVPATDHRADIYALGCGVQMLTGRAVFAATSPQRVIAAHIGEAPPQPIAQLRRDLPPSRARLIVMRCLREGPGRSSARRRRATEGDGEEHHRATARRAR